MRALRKIWAGLPYAAAALIAVPAPLAVVLISVQSCTRWGETTDMDTAAGALLLGAMLYIGVPALLFGLLGYSVARRPLGRRGAARQAVIIFDVAVLSTLFSAVAAGLNADGTSPPAFRWGRFLAYSSMGWVLSLLLMWMNAVGAKREGKTRHVPGPPTGRPGGHT